MTYKLVIFDCDGVLIDVTKSYDVTINKTISYVLKEIAEITVDTPLSNELLLKPISIPPAPENKLKILFIYL